MSPTYNEQLKSFQHKLYIYSHHHTPERRQSKRREKWGQQGSSVVKGLMTWAQPLKPTWGRKELIPQVIFMTSTHVPRYTQTHTHTHIKGVKWKEETGEAERFCWESLWFLTWDFPSSLYGTGSQETLPKQSGRGSKRKLFFAKLRLSQLKN